MGSKKAVSTEVLGVYTIQVSVAKTESLAKLYVGGMAIRPDEA
jgi:hypothetical protein